MQLPSNFAQYDLINDNTESWGKLSDLELATN